MRVYVAGPYTKGDQIENVKRAVNMGDQLVKLGFVPFVPHLNMLWHMLHPHESKFWLDWDFEWLACCDAVLRLDGESPGADAEVKKAMQWGIPVCYTLEQLRIVQRRRGLDCP